MLQRHSGSHDSEWLPGKRLSAKDSVLKAFTLLSKVILQCLLCCARLNGALCDLRTIALSKLCIVACA